MVQLAVAFWISVQAFLFAVAVPLIIHLLKVFGIGIVVYSGATLVLDQGEAYLFSNYNGLPSGLFAMLTIAGFDAGIKMVFAAFAANIALKSSTGGFKKFVFKA